MSKKKSASATAIPPELSSFADALLALDEGQRKTLIDLVAHGDITAAEAGAQVCLLRECHSEKIPSWGGVMHVGVLPPCS